MQNKKIIRLNNLKIKEDLCEDLVIEIGLKKLHLDKKYINNTIISKKSIDARDKSNVTYVYSIDITFYNEEKKESSKSSTSSLNNTVFFDRLLKHQDVIEIKEKELPKPKNIKNFALSPIIIGAGPSRTFCGSYIYRKWSLSNSYRTR